MNYDKKCLSSWLLDSAIFLCLILGSPLTLAAELGVVAHYITATKKTDPCSVVNIHSLIKKDDGKTLYQKGQGWVTKLIKKNSERQLGVVLPYHVVVNASEVYGECHGVYFPLSEPVIDAEADLVHLEISDDDLISKNVVMPLLVEIASEKIRNVVYNPDPAKAVFNQKITPKQMDKQLPDVLDSMNTFGVAVSPSGSAEPSFFLSPNGYDVVAGNVEANLDFFDRYIHIENFGIRPGVSGGVLFGVADNAWSRRYEKNSSKNVYEAPIELMPKTVLGMVVKTKLNGAETVAISLPSITRFLDYHVMNDLKPLKKDYEVHYHEVSGADGRVSLQSYMTVPKEDGAITVQEICSAEFKQSADFVPLLDPKLKKISEEIKLKKDPQVEKLERQLNDLLHRTKPEGARKIDFQNLQKLQKKSGGGEYGEGGDGFSGRQAQYLTSLSYVGSFPQADIGFAASSQVPSFGLYLKNQSCAGQSLAWDDRPVNTLALKGKPLQRLVTYEDVRKAAKYGEKSADILSHYARFETKPFFTFEEKWTEPITLPLLSAQAISSADVNWKPQGKDYFKEKFVTAAKSESSITVSKDVLALNVQITGISETKKMGWLQLSYQEDRWRGRFALNSQCEVSLHPENFKAVHPWLVQYHDEKNDLKIEMGTQNRLLIVTFQKVDCANMKNLVLGEVEVIPNGVMQVGLGPARKSLLAKPIDLLGLKSLLLKSEKSGADQ